MSVDHVFCEVLVTIVTAWVLCFSCIGDVFSTSSVVGRPCDVVCEGGRVCGVREGVVCEEGCKGGCVV